MRTIHGAEILRDTRAPTCAPTIAPMPSRTIGRIFSKQGGLGQVDGDGGGARDEDDELGGCRGQVGWEDECLHDDWHHGDAASDTEQAAHRARRKADDAEQDGAFACEGDAGFLCLFKRAGSAAASNRSDQQVCHEDEGGGAEYGLECASLKLLDDVRADGHAEQACYCHDGGPPVLDALLADVRDGGREGGHEDHRLRHAGDDAGRLVRKNHEEDGDGDESSARADESADCSGEKAEDRHERKEKTVHGVTMARTAWGRVIFSELITNRGGSVMEGTHSGTGRLAVLMACLLGLAALMLVVSGCGGGISLRGEITLEGADELSHIPSSRVVVQLRDISYADAPSIEIASREYENVTTLPLEYELEWDEPLSDRNEYSVGARLYDSEGALIFINDTTFTVRPSDSRVDFYVIAV